ncbi:hypothetical protein [Acetivibrio clariflavus]|uniref:Uncharacterized protein n=1 Tax=Acetivibrio clariflavus (strain DSM 19732 / NBRC 101661 / EBR45) TaxID=720554 RepID=G8LV68_ACECE|nr:hypothetical protein [Acetivibrio clariflavus]AEV67422.1 hypothetical protein Clocl_0719 [Acetivibrio clariflavus DSM 19732]
MRGLIILAFIVGVVLLQIFLSKTESRWPGLVLPIIAFLFSFFLPLNMMIPDDGATASFYVQMAMLWLFGNIPAIILLAIYFVCREKYRRKKQLDKMIIQDLN